MQVIEYAPPPGSRLAQELVGQPYFQDAYRAPLARPEHGIVDLFLPVFGHEPLWIKLLLVVRNAAAKLAGLQVPKVTEIMSPVLESRYGVGDKIGPWPIFFLGVNEIVAGRNNKHLDFRVSVLKAIDGDAASVTGIVAMLQDGDRAFQASAKRPSSR
jgi:hypothetical protein